ncbi:MAG TPA: hypothetical protein VJ279_11910 [Hanamia sp.]|jgi:hypothetical protein|nr:hypothetical protein [Hanamia sp.]
MSEQKNNDDIATMHLSFLGGKLAEGITQFHHDIATNYRYASEIITRLSFVRLLELRDKFQQAASLNK